MDRPDPRQGDHAETAPGVYVAVISGMALVAPLEVPETAFRKLD